MEIPILVEPSTSGFRAQTGAPLDLSADGPTADAATAALNLLVAERLRAGQFRTMTVTDVDGILAAAQRIRENPLFDEFEQGIEEYHQLNNAIPEAD